MEFCRKTDFGIDWQRRADNSERVLRIPRREALKELGISDSAVSEKVFLKLPTTILIIFAKIALQNVKLV